MMKMNTLSTNRLLWLDYVAIAIIVIAFFVISYCGFYFADDFTMAYGGIPIGYGKRVGEITSVFDVFKLTWWWYFHWGGRIFSVAVQYFLCGLLGNKIWFDIVNTMFFILLMVICGRLTNNGDKNGIRYVLVFALLFWFLCPLPDQTLFWIAGSTTYLWANTLTFVFLLLFQKYKEDNFSVVGKLGLFIMSFFAATEYITCASICGAFVVYYAFHIKRFRGNVIPFVIGFAVGSVVVLFAPGNFVRVEDTDISYHDQLLDLVHHPIQEVVKYKTLWLFLIVMVLGWIKNKEVVKIWMKENSILLLSLGWSVVAFSIVFRPHIRALFFPETLSLVLLLRFLYGNYQVFKIRFFKNWSKSSSIVRSTILLVFIVFLVDSAFAVAETKKQKENNNILMEEIANSDGIIALDRMISSHRMAYAAEIFDYTWEALADKFDLDSVRTYPFYCQEKLYRQGPPFENVYIDDGFSKAKRREKYVCLIVRIKTEELQASDNLVTFTIDYTRPRKWYNKSWIDKWRNYQYDRTAIVEMDAPEACFNEYCYYFIWFGRENVKGLKSMKYEIE